MKKRNQVRKNISPAATTPQRKSAAASQRKTTHGRGSNHDAPAAFSEPETMIIMGGNNDNLVRDLDGRLFIVNDEKSCTHEIGYSDALDYCTKHGNWKNPWKVLALHGIKAPSPALKEIVLLEGAVTLLFKAPDGRELERVGFPAAVFKRIQRAAAKRGITLQEFCRTALRNFIKSQAARKAV